MVCLAAYIPCPEAEMAVLRHGDTAWAQQYMEVCSGRVWCYFVSGAYWGFELVMPNLQGLDDGHWMKLQLQNLIAQMPKSGNLVACGLQNFGGI